MKSFWSSPLEYKRHEDRDFFFFFLAILFTDESPVSRRAPFPEQVGA